MAKKLLKQKALEMRAKQMSYSQIKEKLGVGKSTLNYWLKDMPLSKERIDELRGSNPQRIERYRNTMKKKDDAKYLLAYNNVSKKISKFTSRDIFLGGLFLYWAEGGKTDRSTISFSNTNPLMVKFFVKWVTALDVDKRNLKIKIHVYSDMNVDKQIGYWSKILGVNKKQFYKPYIKESKLSSITYTNGFGQGTCSVIYSNRKMADFVLMGLKRIQDIL